MVLVLGLVLMVGLRELVNRTKLGKQTDREAAEMMGINVNFTISATFFLGSALAGVGQRVNQVIPTMRVHRGLQGVHRRRGRRHRLHPRGMLGTGVTACDV